MLIANACAKRQDVFDAFPQWRHRDDVEGEAIEQVLAKLALGRQAPAGPRWSSRRCARRPAAFRCRRHAESRRTRSCAVSSPACAARSSPARRESACRRPRARNARCGFCAPVNAPASWPNSSDSRIDSVSAAQLTLTTRCSQRLGQKVQPRRDQLLAGAALADDEHRLGQRRRARHVLQHFEEGRGLTDDRLGCRVIRHW